MTVVKFVKRFLHLYPPWINGRCCYRSSSTVRKDSQTHTTEEKNARRVTQMKWQATNKQFYGPVVKETDDKKKRASSLFKFKDSTKKLLPVGLWSDLAVQKYGRKIQIVNAIRSSSSDADKPLPIKARDDPSPSTLLSDSSNDADRPLIKVPEASRSQSAALINDSTPDKPLTVMPAPSQPSSTVLRSSSHEPCPTVLEPQVATSPELPGLPFYQKNNVILPFPMVPGTKKVLLEDGGTGTEISSLPSPEEKYPSVTTILKETMTKDNEAVLDAWRKRKIAEVGEDGFREFMRDAFYVGRQLHVSIETRLRGVDYDAVHVEPRISGHWLSLKAVLSSMEDVKALESCVVHRNLKYKGFLDCVARYKGQLVAIEWKTSQRVKNTLKQAYDDPIQIAAYIGALNADENYPFKVANALLVVAYPTGRPADVMQLDQAKCEHYWLKWLKRLEKYNHLKERTTTTTESSW